MSAAVAMLLSLDHLHRASSATSPTLPSRSTMRAAEATALGAGRSPLAGHHAARDLRHLAGVLDRVLPDLLHLHVLGARQHGDHAGRPKRSRSFEPLGVILLSPVLVGALGVAAAPQRRAVDAGEDAARRRCWSRSAFAHARRTPARIGGDTGRVSPSWLICGQSHHRASAKSRSARWGCRSSTACRRRAARADDGRLVRQPRPRRHSCRAPSAPTGITMPHSRFFLMVVAILSSPRCR